MTSIKKLTGAYNADIANDNNGPNRFVSRAAMLVPVVGPLTLLVDAMNGGKKNPLSTRELMKFNRLLAMETEVLPPDERRSLATAVRSLPVIQDFVGGTGETRNPRFQASIDLLRTMLGRLEQGRSALGVDEAPKTTGKTTGKAGLSPGQALKPKQTRGVRS